MESTMQMAHPHMVSQSPSPVPFTSPYAALNDSSNLPLDLLYGLDDFGTYHGINMSSMMAANGGLASGPATPPLEGLPREGLDPHLISAIIQNDFKNVKRRMQNREAQRRFRERKEQRQKTLQQKADDLRGEYQKLCDEYSKSTGEVSRLLKENDVLRSEIKNLRQQWRLMLTVMQQQRTPSQSPPVNQVDPVFLDTFRGYLDELAEDDETTPHCL